MTRREISTFWARRIRWGLKAGQTPAWWPVYIWLGPTRRAFNRSFNRLSSGISTYGWPCSTTAEFRNNTGGRSR